MSSLVISGDTSGSVTLQAPAVAGSTVLTLPATSGTVLTTTSGTAATATNLAGGSAGVLPFQTGSGATSFTAAGTAGQILQSNGASAPTWVAAPSGGFTLGTPVDLSTGTLTSVDYTGIPNGTKQIIISFAGIGTDTSSILVQIGDAGGIENTGYVSGSFRTTNVGATATDGFNIYMIITSNAFYGQMVLMLENSTTNNWVSSHCGRGLSSASTMGGGSKSLTQTLDRLRITTVNGTDVFDAGEVNIAYI